MSNRRTREKRRARREGAAQTAGEGLQRGASDLVPHTQRCPCAACEKERADQITRGIPRTEARLLDYHCGHPHPEHRDDLQWRISGHRLIEFFATHEQLRDKKAHLTRVVMRPEFVSYLDQHTDEQELHAGLLGEALVILGRVATLHGPLRARLIRACAIEGLSQDEVARREYLSQPTVSRNLEAGLAALLEIYGGLLLVEQQHAAS